MVHEAGHTLGLSGFSLGDLLSEERIYTNAHPKIPDSIVGYDNKTNVRPSPAAFHGRWSIVRTWISRIDGWEPC